MIIRNMRSFGTLCVEWLESHCHPPIPLQNFDNLMQSGSTSVPKDSGCLPSPEFTDLVSTFSDSTLP